MEKDLGVPRNDTIFFAFEANNYTKLMYYNAIYEIYKSCKRLVTINTLVITNFDWYILRFKHNYIYVCVKR